MTTPCYLLDHIVAINKLSNDAGLARELGAFPLTICRLCKEKLPLGVATINVIHERFDIPIANAGVYVQERHSQVGN
jgi:hypothetical protein